MKKQQVNTQTMITPSIEELTKGKMNRYALVMATAKAAKIVTDEYIEQREAAEKKIANKETDKPLSALIDPELRDKKAVRNAVNRMYDGEIVIKEPEELEEADEETLGWAKSCGRRACICSTCRFIWIASTHIMCRSRWER